jgi:uncharacterized protein (TIGR02391 family)
MKDQIFKAQELYKSINKLPGITILDKERKEISLDSIIRDEELRKIVGKLYKDGHHARAVEEAFKFLNNIVKKKAQTASSVDGAGLMRLVFSANTPILKLNSGTSKSEKDEQLGYMEIFSGCMTGIRNPRAHEHDWEDTEFRALQLIILADHLIEKVRKSTK